MKIPNNMTEKEVIEIIDSVIKYLCNKYTFGFYDEEDIYQEAFIIAMSGLEKFDPEKASLKTFLQTHISNKLKTFKRDNYFRLEQLCSVCFDGTCKKCQKRAAVREIKKNLIDTVNIENVEFSYNQPILDKFARDELFNIIDEKLDVLLRNDYLKMLEGVPVPANKKRRISEEILRILSEKKDGE